MKKYHGIISALYASYDELGCINLDGTKALTQHLIDKKVTGVYVGGSSGECIYQSVFERKQVLESVMEVAKGKIRVIAHVACNNTQDSCELAKHAESLGVDAIAAIPPIYFRLPAYSIIEYWNEISKAAPNTDFFIYNIPQLAGSELTPDMLKEMLKNPLVKGVKNSSMPVMDIQKFKSIVGEDLFVFNGPDEQLHSGLAAGADGAIGGTFGAMPELYIEIEKLFNKGEHAKATLIQNDACEIIYKMCSCKGNMYAVIKEILRRRHNVDCGGVRKPLQNLFEEDMEIIDVCVTMIDTAISKYID